MIEVASLLITVLLVIIAVVMKSIANSMDQLNDRAKFLVEMVFERVPSNSKALVDPLRKELEFIRNSIHAVESANDEFYEELKKYLRDPQAWRANERIFDDALNANSNDRCIYQSSLTLMR